MTPALPGLVLFALLSAAVPSVAAEGSLQALVDATPDGGTLRPPPGTYAGPLILSRPITLDGGGLVSVSGGGVDTVVTIHGDGVTLQGLAIRDSGHRHEHLDACIRIENGKFNVVKDNVLTGCLVGLDLRHADSNVVRRNSIQGSDHELDMRGDGIRIWYSNDNRLEGNTVADHRDVLLEYSTRNLLRGNSVTNGRYGTHCMYASGNTLEDNFYAYNTVGVFSMYSNKLVIKGNKITHGNGPAAMGIGLKEASDLTIEGNQVLGNAVGVYIDDSPFDTDQHNNFHGNRFGYNGVAIRFLSDLGGNSITGNDFVGNHSQVMVSGGGDALSTEWDGNYWDLYEGFDKAGRGIGDSPYEIYAYADRLWMEVPAAAFFRGSPMLESLDFLARLAPFSKPKLILRDAKPAMHRLTG